jgi:putative restriction endonuclease
LDILIPVAVTPFRSAYIAHTHREWFDYLSTLAAAERSGAGPLRLDEVNFWSPRSPEPLRKNFAPGEPIFFRLGAPIRHVVGYGFFATFYPADVHLAWDLFLVKNGAASKAELARLLGRQTLNELEKPLGCTVLRDAVFWPEAQWIPWGSNMGYADSGVQRGLTEDEPVRVQTLFDAIVRDGVEGPSELTQKFLPIEVDDRRWADAIRVDREGRGTFRLRLLQAYGGRCAITNEHTEPVLDAAHIQPYLGPLSNHVQNGILLTKEFHTLFDKGLATIEPPDATRQGYRLRLSTQIADRWKNGHRYYEYKDSELAVPDDPSLQPSPLALAWHHEHIFERV